jgi:hypothetical protein
VLTAAQLNTYLSNAVSFFLAPPLALLRQTVAQSVPTGAFTALTMDTEDLDRDGGHSTTTNTSRYTAQTAGYYLCSGLVGWSSSATGRRATRWQVNGSATNASDAIFAAVIASAINVVPPTKPIFLNVGDYLEMAAFQDSGGALLTAVAVGSDQPGSSILWVSS